MNIIKLFLEFIKIGLFSFGGGLGTLPYIYEMANRTGWISTTYINKILTVSQVTPGPLACNIGSIVGFKINGLAGALISNIGFVLPAICIMGIGYKFISKIKNNEKANEIINIVRCSALAIMIGSSLTLFKSAFLVDNYAQNWLELNNIVNYKNIAIAIGIYFLSKWKKINSLILICISSITAIILQV